MSDIVIKAAGLGKRYRLGQMHSDLLSERLSTGLKSLCDRFRRRNFSLFTFHLSRKKNLSPFTFDVSQSKNLSPSVSHFSPLTFNLSPEKDFWALKDVSFEIKQGEVVGIIGRNGAGKSTLLKILSRITEPTEGMVELYGRVGSLLEVGTGFHPELTGRENIFLNGAILGMSRAEITKKFDEIVAFAEVEKFLDTPVKRYSSGMYVRLAFAVAAHLDPEILLVDEVLAVGDVQFQKKCLGKMGEVAKEGRTVLFVSHNMGAVLFLCSKTIVLDHGRFMFEGSAEEAVKTYLGNSGNNKSCVNQDLINLPRRFETPGVRLLSAEIMNADGLLKQSFGGEETLRINLVFALYDSLTIGVEAALNSDMGVRLTSFASTYFCKREFSCTPGIHSATLIIPSPNLSRGQYHFDFAIYNSVDFKWLDYVESALNFTIEYSDPEKTGFDFGRYRGHGLIYIKHRWEKSDSVENLDIRQDEV